MKLNTEALDRSHHEIADLAVKAFELSQTLREQWLTADHATKRRILEIVCLNCTLVDASLVCEMRKPFDVLAEGLVSENSRGDWRSFEPLLAAYVDAALAPSAEAVAVSRVMWISA